MKNVILSADGDRMVYSVPDAVADNLAEYCLEFCGRWLHKSPDAEKYRISEKIVCYTEADFIDYLNKYIFPAERSVFVKNLCPAYPGSDLPEEYGDCPYFNF